MDELVRLVAQKTGISEAQAKTAATTVIGFLKDRLPAPLAGQLDQYVGGSAGTEGGMGGVVKGLGGILGG